jgi:hypothetical protein
MRWPFQTKQEVAPETASQTEWSRPASRHSPGLETVLGRLREDQRHRVLDLGAAVGANLEYYSQFADHVRVVDLLADGEPLPFQGDSDQPRLERVVRTMFPDAWGPYDLVFVWDLLNYLQEGEARAVVGRAIELCNPGAALLSLVVSTEVMSERPLRFTILDRATLEYRAVTPDTTRSPGWPSSTIERIHRGCRMERSFLLRHGIQEYVAVRI